MMWLASKPVIIAPRPGIHRAMGGFQVADYDLPPGTCAACFPECNALIPLWHYAEGSKTPAAKSVPIWVRPD